MLITSFFEFVNVRDFQYGINQEILLALPRGISDNLYSSF